MARKNKRRKSLNLIAGTLALLLIAFCVLCSLDDKYGLGMGMPRLDAFSFDLPLDFFSDFIGDNLGEALEVMGREDPDASMPLKVHFIDVGQGKGIFIQAPGGNILIDAGEITEGAAVLGYLKTRGVKKLDILIGTHPHSDHIGGMDAVIDGLDIGTVIFPDIPDDLVPTTKTYTDVLLAIAKKGLKITPAEPGKIYDIGGGARITILGPDGNYAELNNISAVLRLDYGEISFLFTGDMQKEAEADLLSSGRNLSADVLDAGHHGSDTSCTAEFLKAVSPGTAVISCGIDNSYGHPSREAVERLEAAGAKIYRTDLDGTVVISTDGTELSVSVTK